MGTTNIFTILTGVISLVVAISCDTPTDTTEYSPFRVNVDIGELEGLSFAEKLERIREQTGLIILVDSTIFQSYLEGRIGRQEFDDSSTEEADDFGFEETSEGAGETSTGMHLSARSALIDLARKNNVSCGFVGRRTVIIYSPSNVPEVVE